MRREKKQEEGEERYRAKRDLLRAKRQKNSNSLFPSGVGGSESEEGFLESSRLRGPASVNSEAGGK
jgi:hypothetical protein